MVSNINEPFKLGRVLGNIFGIHLVTSSFRTDMSTARHVGIQMFTLVGLARFSLEALNHSTCQ